MNSSNMQKVKQMMANWHRLGDPEPRSAPYAVLVGDVGTGKSTIVEKLTGQKGRSSDSDESFTRSTEYLWVADKSLLISDTPGANPMKEKLEHNVQIAAAFNLQKVSKIFIVVKADTRIDSTIDDVRKYADRFVSLPMNAVAILVTHMDTVKWSHEKFLEACDEELGIEQAVFSGKGTSSKKLLSTIIKVCGKEKHDLTVTSENFLRMFKIHNSNRKILQITSDAVQRFIKIKIEFEEEKEKFEGKDLVDLYFEFQVFMTGEITRAQQKMANDLTFTFLGSNGPNEAGHVANMVNQLRVILYDVRMAALYYQNDHGITDLRKCPHCGKIWAKTEGCNGATKCGNRPSSQLDVRDQSFTELCTFVFSTVTGRLCITKRGTKAVTAKPINESFQYGCGKDITWSKMATVEVPKEFHVAPKVSTDDISYLPLQLGQLGSVLQNLLDYAGSKLGFA